MANKNDLIDQRNELQEIIDLAKSFLKLEPVRNGDLTLALDCIRCDLFNLYPEHYDPEQPE